jgi:hypothetical protein
MPGCAVRKHQAPIRNEKRPTVRQSSWPSPSRTSGGQRIHDPELLLQRIQEHNLPREAFRQDIDLRKYGTAPHGGFFMVTSMRRFRE